LSKLINSKFYMMLWKPNQFSYIYRASENWLGFQVRISNSPNFYMMLSKPDQLSLSLSLSLSLTHTHTHTYWTSENWLGLFQTHLILK
jgi:hypothetical protein